MGQLDIRIQVFKASHIHRVAIVVSDDVRQLRSGRTFRMKSVMVRFLVERFLRLSTVRS